MIKTIFTTAFIGLSLSTHAGSYGQFTLSDKVAADAKKMIVATITSSEKKRNDINAACGGLDYLYDAKPANLILLPIAQNFEQDTNISPNKVTTYTELRVSGLGYHLGNKGQSYPQCVLKVILVENSDRKGTRIQIQDISVDTNLSGHAEVQ